MKVAIVPQDHEGAGSYRLLYPLEQLARRGEVEFVEFTKRIDETINDKRTTIYDLTDPPAADLYVLQRPLELDVLDGLADLQRWAPVIVELDDDLMALQPGNQAFAGTSPKWQDRARAWAEEQGLDKISKKDIFHFAAMAQLTNRDILHKIIHKADGVTVSTPALQRRYQREHVYLCPNWLRWADWAELKPFQGRYFTVGYMGDARWKKNDLKLLHGLIGPWLARHPDARFFAAGDPTVLSLLDIDPRQGTFVPRAMFPAHRHFIGNMHVGLIPLQENAFNQAKSALTAMELNAAYVPVIASPTDSYCAYKEQGGSIVLAEKPRDWLRELDRHYDEWQTGNYKGLQQGTRETAKRFTIEDDRHSDVWLKAYKEVCLRHSKRSGSSRTMSPQP